MSIISRKVNNNIISLIKKSGEKDLRIGQLFEILRSKVEEDGKDIFYIENNKLEEYLSKFLES